MDQPRRLLLHRLDDGRVAVSCGADGDAGEEIEEAVAVYIGEPAAFAPLWHQRVNTSQAIAGDFLIAFNVRSGFGAWQQTVDFDAGGKGGDGGGCRR